MKIAFTKREEITAKNGHKYVMYKGIGMDGGTVEVFLTPEGEAEYGLSQEHLASKETLKDFLSNAPIVDVEFNQRGRVAAIEV